LTLPPDANAETRAAIILVTAGMPVFWFSFVTLGLSTPVMRRAYMRCSRWIDRVAGTFLALFGLRLMFSGQK
jgi:threonine/homoserine/homoserine lactone efflux protein